ncbi:MAG: type IV secretion system DNA-binding domain-containing protein [Mucilaginibacter sp.]
MMTPAQALTAQFYEWERRGRGWFLADGMVDLEPAFEPFWGHFTEGDIIDDGRSPHWLAALFGASAPARRPAVPRETVMAYAGDEDDSLTVYAVTLPRSDRAGMAQAEQLIVMLSYRPTPVSFEMVADKDTVSLQWACRDAAADFLLIQLRAFFPEVRVAETYDDRLFELLQDGEAFYTVDFGLEEEFMRPIATPGNSEPLTALFGVLEHLRDGQGAVVQVLFTGTSNPWKESVMNSVCDDGGKTSFFIDEPDMPRLAHEKTARPLCAATVRCVAMGDTLEDAHGLLQHLSTALIHASNSPSNRLMPLPQFEGDPDYPVGSRLSDILMRRSQRVGMLLNASELATLVHYPDAALRTGKVIPQRRTSKAAPASLVGQQYALGKNAHNGTVQDVGLTTDQRLRHMHIIGATGTGKSTLLHSLVMQDIVQGNGCMVLDPHGDLIARVLSDIPQSRVADVVLLDPSDGGFPVACNILRADTDTERELLASDLVTLFRRFSTSWGDQMHSVLANALLALLYNTRTFHLGDLRRFLIEPAVRTTVLSTVTDPDIAYYWQREFPILKGGSIGPLVTRLDSFLRPRAIRSMVCQERGLDMAHLMDSGKIMLVRLAEGLLGAENSYLLGALIVSRLQQTAMARQAQAAADRVPFFCYVDEFQHFVTPSMASILSGARKYALGLVLAHQDMQQVAKYDAEVAGSVLANAATRVCFRLGDADARRLKEGFSSFAVEDLQNLQTGEAIARVGTPENDFSLTITPCRGDGTDRTEAIVAHSRRTYGTVAPEQRTAVVPEAQQPAPPPPPTIATQPPKEEQSLREHRHTQLLVKRLAEGLGYRASVEARTPAGDGMVDVLIERDGVTIAVEVSVTTPAAWEVHNVRKCLAAGYERVIVCTDSAAKRRAIRQRVSAELPPPDQARVAVAASSELGALLAVPHAAAPAEATHKGYRVRVQYEDSASRQDLVRRIVSATRRPQ